MSSKHQVSLINCQNLCFQVGNTSLLKDLDCHFEGGAVSVVLGKNGAGKSTLLKLLSKEVEISSGDILFDNQSINDISFADMALTRSVLAQSTQFAFSMTVADLVQLGADVQGLINQDVLAEILKLCDLKDFAARDVLTLSGGELQRAQLARVLAQIWPNQGSQKSNEGAFSGKWLLLDEWSNNLDLHHHQSFSAIFKSLTKQGLGIIMVLHDLNLAAQLADEVKVLKDGKLVLEGKPQKVLTKQNLEHALDLKVSVHLNQNQEQEAQAYQLYMRL